MVLQKTDANKVLIIQQRKNEAFGEEYDAFVDTLSKKINEKLWENIAKVMLNIVLLMIEIFAGKKYIGAGTIVNALFLGYFSTFFNFVLVHTVNAPQAMWQRVIVVCLGVIICSLGLSLYQSADVGVAPYDSLPMILSERWPKFLISATGFLSMRCLH